MMLKPLIVLAGAALVMASPAFAQPTLREALQHHGVALADRGIEGAFDAAIAPTIAVTPGSFTAPLALLASGQGRDRIDAAYAFGILAGRAAIGVAPGDLSAATQALLQMMGSTDRRSRIAGARVAGRLYAASLQNPAGAGLPAGLVDALFAVLNQDDEFDQLAAMDALGLTRAATAVPSLTERYAFYRDAGQRGLAGGALEALARIGDAATVDLVKRVSVEPWGAGKDSTALAVAFARERMLKDGSLATIQQALGDKSRRVQARGYLIELGVPVP